MLKKTINLLNKKTPAPKSYNDVLKKYFSCFVKILHNFDLQIVKTIKMKFLLKLGAMLILASIIKPNTIKSQDIGNWYMCNYCCKTKRAPSTPWENGCYSGQHQFQLLGKAGNFNYTCKNCKAEVYLISSQTPNASKCCNGITHSWYRK